MLFIYWFNLSQRYLCSFSLRANDLSANWASVMLLNPFFNAFFVEDMLLVATKFSNWLFQVALKILHANNAFNVMVLRKVEVVYMAVDVFNSSCKGICSSENRSTNVLLLSLGHILVIIRAHLWSSKASAAANCPYHVNRSESHLDHWVDNSTHRLQNGKLIRHGFLENTIVNTREIEEERNKDSNVPQKQYHWETTATIIRGTEHKENT